MPTTIRDETHVSEYKTMNDDDAPFFLPCGHHAGNIHRDENGVPYLATIGANGMVYYHYGYTPIHCHCKQVGEWLPDRSGMLAVIDAWKRRREMARRARAELGG